MARLKNSVQTTTLSYDSLTSPILFVVDMVNGFVREGALHDKAIETIIQPIKDLIDGLDCRNIFIADTHPPMAKEFQAFPPHCVIGTSECEIVNELKPYIHELICKNSTNTFFAPDFQIFLQERFHQYQDIVICGCCSDICIMQFALSLQAYINEHNLPQRIIVASNAVETYHIDGIHDACDWNQFALNAMAASGICVVDHLLKGE